LRSLNLLYVDTCNIIWGVGVAQSMQSLGYGLDDRGSITGEGNYDIFLFAAASRPAVEPTQPPNGYLGLLGLKRPECEDEHSPPTNAGVHISSWRSA
jgi:hypothetical protein